MSDPVVPPESLTPSRVVSVTRVTDRGSERTSDVAAAEEPLDVRLHGRSFAIIMRTPGDDRALVAGFLQSERIIRSADDIGAVEHCRHPDHATAHHVLADVAPLSSTAVIDVAVIRSLPSRLRARQSTFDETGGLHGAAICASSGEIVAAAEDVGRHNAVDKAIGALLLEDAPRPPALTPAALIVSGRVSFEIVQKAWLAGIPLVAAISAPTSLAVELAEQAGITLIGFLRDTGLNIYAHPSRVRGV